MFDITFEYNKYRIIQNKISITFSLCSLKKKNFQFILDLNMVIIYFR